MTETRLSSGLEDYLEYIYNAVEEKGSVKAIDIARDQNISRASVTDALQRLAAKEYINYERYGKISLLEKGIKKSQEIIEKHNILKTFFEEILGLDNSEASENACRIEHVITPNALKQLKEYTLKGKRWLVA